MAQRRSAQAAPVNRAPAPNDSAREVELKLKLRAQDLPTLRARLEQFAPARRAYIDNIYYDTPDLRLAAARAALRLRSIQRGRRRLWVQTFKTEDHETALSVRGEWETPAPGGRLDAARLAHSPLARLLGGAHGQDRAGSERIGTLVPVFRTVFDRTAWDLQAFGARIEAVIDVGEIQARGRVEPILEIELELLSGEPAALIDLALELAGARSSERRAADVCLLPYGASKAARGVRLALGREPFEPMPGLIKGRADRSGHAAFDAEQPLAQAARRWMAQGLAALLANAVGALRSDQPEFVHQARIALRLIRVGMEVLAPALDLAPVHGRALQTWTKEFGAVRDWDVLCGQLLPSLRRDAGEDGAARWERLQQAAVRRQQRARERLRRRLDAPGFGEFALHLLRWSVSEPQEQGARLGAFAQKAVRQRRHRLAKAARGFAGASMARQHKIRLQAKSLRYAIETLHGVLPGALRGAELRTLSRFQDSAGCARDLALAESTLEGLTSSRQLRRQIADWTREQRRIGLEKAQRLAAELANW